jgi:phospholipid-translocating ATPase
MRINLDLGKVWYSYCIQTDSEIDGTIARTTTIPEELGRV